MSLTKEVKRTLQCRINHAWGVWCIDAESETIERRSWGNAFCVKCTPVGIGRWRRIGPGKIFAEKRLRSGQSI